MKFSIVTPVRNAASKIRPCLEGIALQTGVQVEHIIIDAASTDGTIDVIKKSGRPPEILVSEPDLGIFDGMNKGIRLASGDIIGILNADDVYASNDVLSTVGEALEKSGAESCFGDVDYISGRKDGRIVRRWRTKKPYRPELFRKGWMPPHTAFFVRKSVYDRYGLFDLDFPIAADYELMLRFLYFRRVSSVHIPKVMVLMRWDGNSRPGPVNTYRMMVENRRSWIKNGEKPRPLMIFLKRLSKLGQFFL